MRTLHSELCVWCGQPIADVVLFEGIMCLACVPALLSAIQDRLEEFRPVHTRGGPRLRLVVRSG